MRGVLIEFRKNKNHCMFCYLLIQQSVHINFKLMLVQTRIEYKKIQIKIWCFDVPKTFKNARRQLRNIKLLVYWKPKFCL